MRRLKDDRCARFARPESQPKTAASFGPSNVMATAAGRRRTRAKTRATQCSTSARRSVAVRGILVTRSRALPLCELVEAAVAALGAGRASDLFFAAERQYWTGRNRAAQHQKGRQDAPASAGRITIIIRTAAAAIISAG